MTGYRELLEKEVIEAWRTYRVAVVCALFVVLGIVTTVVTRYLPELTRILDPTAELGLEDTGITDAVDLLVRTFLQVGPVAAILLAMGSVAGERERGTTALILARPVARLAYLLAKLVAIAMVLALGTGLGVLAAFLYAGLLFQPPSPIGWVQLALLLWLSMLVYAAVTFAASTVLRSPAGAAAIGVAAIVGFALLSAAPIPNFWLPTGLGEVARAVALEDIGPEVDAARSVGVSIAIVALAFLVAWLSFRRQDA